MEVIGCQLEILLAPTNFLLQHFIVYFSGALLLLLTFFRSFSWQMSLRSKADEDVVFVRFLVVSSWLWTVKAGDAARSERDHVLADRRRNLVAILGIQIACEAL